MEARSAPLSTIFRACSVMRDRVTASSSETSTSPASTIRLPARNVCCVEISKKPFVPAGSPSQPKRAEASRSARGACRHPGRIEAIPSKGTPRIAMSASMAEGSKTYGALQNVAMPVCGNEAGGRDAGIWYEILLLGSDFKDEAEVAVCSHLIRYWKLSEIDCSSCRMTDNSEVVTDLSCR